MGFDKYKDESPKDKWIRKLKTYADGTIRQYEEKLKEFLDFHEVTIELFIEEARENITENRSINWIEQGWMEFKQYLMEERDLSETTAKNYLSPINVLLKIHGLPRINQKWDIPSEGKNAITPDQLKKLLRYCGTDLRARAAILILKDTGLRISDVAERLMVDDFLKAEVIRDKEGREYRKWRKPLITKKGSIPAYIHLGYESIEAVKDYINDRRKGHIFVTKEKHLDNPAGSPITSAALNKTIRIKMNPLKERGLNISTHSIRKFFITNLVVNGIPLEMVKQFCGKAVDANDATYLKWEHEMTDRYLESYPKALAIYESGIVSEKLQEELKEMKEIVVKQKLEAEDYKQKTQVLEKELEKLQEQNKENVYIINRLDDNYAQLKGTYSDTIQMVMKVLRQKMTEEELTEMEKEFTA